MNLTADLFTKISSHAKPAIALGLAQFLGDALDHYGIGGKATAYFLGQAAQESDGFHTLVEYASGEAYEGRADLGNVHPGDGKLYRGRGIFQLTGRSNYRKYGHLLGVDLEGHPDFAALPQYAALVACQYWSDHDLNGPATADDIKAVTKAINGGLTGLTDRKTYTQRAAAELKIKIDPTKW